MEHSTVADPVFFLGGGGGGAQEMRAHYEREARSPLRPGSMARFIRALEAPGDFDAFSYYLSLILSILIQLDKKQT